MPRVQPRQIAPAQWAKYQMAMPRMSPDGKSVVFVGGIMSDFGPLGGEIYEVASAAAAHRA